MRRVRIAIAAALVASALTGCISIPTGGGVVTEQIDVGDVEGDLGTLPGSPVVDATPEEIIEGFIRAGRGPQNQYKVAREYLTDEFSAQWLPTERVIVSSSAIAPVISSDGAYGVSISVSATVDADGRYTTVQPADSESLSFTLVQDADEQWRISSAPNGTVLPPTRFASIFNPYELYFFDPSFQYLVPELRWFVTRNVGSRIVGELLDGPSSWYASGALLSAFPEGTELDGQVTVGSGLASVPLTSGVQAENAVTQRRMLAQLNTSLAALGTISSVSILVGGFALDVASSGDGPDANPQVGADPVGARDGAFGILGPDGVEPLTAIGSSADALIPVAASLARARDAVALRSQAGAVYLVSESGAVLLDSRPGLVTPSIDPRGYTWSVPVSAPGALLAFGTDAVPHAVPGLPTDAQVISIDVSRDGARLLAALRTPTGPALLVAGIVRDADGVPVSLVPPVALPIAGDALRDAAWVDGVQVATLGAPDADGQTAVDVYEIGGQHVSLGSLADGRVIVGGNAAEVGLRVLDGDGIVRRPSGGSSWQDTGLVASFLATQQ